MLNLAAATMYLFVASSCFLAANTAYRQRQLPSHLRSWLFTALVFVVLAVVRVLGLEDLVRDELRLALYVDGTYEERRTFQRPIVASVIVMASALAGWWVLRVVRRAQGRRNVATIIALSVTGVMILLVSLRIVSLHAVDAILYGPAKINWIVEAGSCLVVIGSALTYWRVVTGRA